MTLIYLVKNLEDGKEKAKEISLEELDKLDKLNVYNARINENIGDKERIGITREDIQVMVNLGYKEIYMVEVYNRIKSMAERI